MAIAGEIVSVEYYDPATDTFVTTPPTIMVDSFCGVRVKVKNTGDSATATVGTRILDPAKVVVYEPPAQTFSLASGEEAYAIPVLYAVKVVGDYSAEIIFLLNTTEVDKWSGKIATVVEKVPVPPVIGLTEMMMMLMMLLLVAWVLKGFVQLLPGR